MKYERIAVLRGGPSEEYETSMKTGIAVIESLQKQEYLVKDIVITKSGEWLDNGFVKSPNQVLEGIDIVFLALHGGYGEDGEVQKLLQRNKVKFTGSNSFPSALAFNKAMTKKEIKKMGILTPKSLEISRDIWNDYEGDFAVSQIESLVGSKVIIKPISSGSSAGIKFVNDKTQTSQVINELLENYDKLLVEEFISGREVTCGALENFREQELYVFPAVEIITNQDDCFFTTEAKYNGKTTEICPAQLSFDQRANIAETTAKVHKELKLSQYSRSDYIINDDKLYFLEVNTLPGLTKESLYPKAAEAVGLSFDKLVEHLIMNAKN